MPTEIKRTIKDGCAVRTYVTYKCQYCSITRPYLREIEKHERVCPRRE